MIVRVFAARDEVEVVLCYGGAPVVFKMRGGPRGLLDGFRLMRWTLRYMLLWRDYAHTYVDGDTGEVIDRG